MGDTDYLKEWASKPASGGGNYIKDGRGKLIVKNMSVQKTFKDPKTAIFEFYVKEAFPTGETDSTGKPYPCNAVGSSVSFTQLLTKFESAMGNAKGCFVAVIGPEAETIGDGDLLKQFVEVLNIGPNGVTENGKVSIARGLEVSFETFRKWTKDKSKELVLPRFSHVALTEAQITANRALLNGATAEDVAA